MAPLVMPTEDRPVSTYNVSIFCEKILGEKSPNPHMVLDPSACPQSTAMVRSLELLKYDSWRHRRHEFVVLDIQYEGKDYLIHINRGWAGEGWWEYIPWVTWGSVKAAEDCVAIYIPGEDERRERVGVHRVYRLVFDGQNVTLGSIALIQHVANVNLAPYSLFGMNCWGTSRVLTASVVLSFGSFIKSAEDRRGPTTINAVSLELRRDPWFAYNVVETIVISPLDREANGSCCTTSAGLTLQLNFDRSTTRIPVRSSSKAAITTIFHLQDVQAISQVVLGQNPYSSSTPFHRTTPSNIYPPEAYCCQPPADCGCHKEGLHGIRNLATDGEAEDIPPSEDMNSLCSAGNFLYLLTPPLRLGRRKRSVVIEGNVSFGVVITRKAFDRISSIPGRDGTMPYFEVAWVQILHGPERVMVEASERYTVARCRFPESWLESVNFSLDISIESGHPIIQQAEDGYMLGLWIRSPAPNYVLQTCMLVAYWRFYST